MGWKCLILFTVMSSSVAAMADQDYYIKTASGFTKVDKTQATLELLQKHGQVFKCNEQLLTSKLTMKAKPKTDD